MAKLLSGTLPSLNVGISSYSESKQTLTVVGLSTFTGDIKARSDLYVDTIRRYTDNSTNTKITLESGRVKLFAGNGTTPKININGGVGINTSLNVTGIATFKTDVNVEGDLNVTGDIVYDESSGRNLNITGISTFGGAVNFGASSSISIGSTTGEDGQYLQSTGTGVTWASGSVLRNTSSTVATAGTDTFTLNYTTGFLDVYVNGVKLAPTEFTATNGTSVVLGEAAFGGETVDFHAFNTPSTGVSPNVLHDPPATSSSTGLAGQMSYDSDYLYVCIATNTWKRAALSTF